MEVGVDEQLLEDGELAAEGDQGDLGGEDPVDGAELGLEVLTDVEGGEAAAGLLVRLGVVRVLDRVEAQGVGVLDLVGEARGLTHGTEATPGTDAEPVGDVVVEVGSDQHGALVLVEEREGDHRRELEAPLAVEAELADGGSTGEGAGDLNFLCRGFRGERQDADERHQPLEESTGHRFRPSFGHAWRAHLGSRYSNEKGRKIESPS